MFTNDLENNSKITKSCLPLSTRKKRKTSKINLSYKNEKKLSLPTTTLLICFL